MLLCQFLLCIVFPNGRSSKCPSLWDSGRDGEYKEGTLLEAEKKKRFYCQKQEAQKTQEFFSEFFINGSSAAVRREGD